MFCQICYTAPPDEIANITGIYNRDIKNYLWACIAFHRKRDNKCVDFGQKCKNCGSTYVTRATNNNNKDEQRFICSNCKKSWTIPIPILVGLLQDSNNQKALTALRDRGLV